MSSLFLGCTRVCFPLVSVFSQVKIQVELIMHIFKTRSELTHQVCCQISALFLCSLQGKVVAALKNLLPSTQAFVSIPDSLVISFPHSSSVSPFFADC